MASEIFEGEKKSGERGVKPARDDASGHQREERMRRMRVVKARPSG
jgi:hypothetical protein